MLIFLLLVGVMASLINGTDVTTIGSPVFVIPLLTVHSPGNCYYNTAGNWVCDGIPFIGGVLDFGASIVNLIVGFANFLIAMASKIAGLVGFFTGLTALFFGGQLSMPEPFNWMAGIIVFFAWSFLVMDTVSRVKNMFLPGGGG
jgi:hypothetical protein